MLGRRALDTNSTLLDSLPQALSEVATLIRTALPMASLVAGGRSARESELGSIAQPPEGGSHTTRASLKVIGVLPIGTCSVSPWAVPGKSQLAHSSTNQATKWASDEPGTERASMPGPTLATHRTAPQSRAQ